MVLFSLPFFMEICNSDLLQLIECIELMKNDVKRKMSPRVHSNDVLKSPTSDRSLNSIPHSWFTPIFFWSNCFGGMRCTLHVHSHHFFCRALDPRTIDGPTLFGSNHL